VCAHAVSVAVKKVNGVQDVNVSLNEGKASINFTPTSTGKYSDVRTFIEKNGFVVREAQVRVRGKLQQSASGLQFIVSGSGETFEILPNSSLMQTLEQNVNRELVLEGTVPAPEKNKDQHGLFVRQLVLETSK
jgi:copper chaperone CopZ